MTSRPVCGNDPRTTLTDGDRVAVEEFMDHLRQRKARKIELKRLHCEALGCATCPDDAPCLCVCHREEQQ